MRRLTVGLLAVGCLALLAGTLFVAMPVVLRAQPVFDTLECPIDTTCNGGVEKVRVCHIAEGKAPVALCVNASAFPPHFAGEEDGHSKDFCLNAEVKVCADPGDPK
jgi:hypothetical protein